MHVGTITHNLSKGGILSPADLLVSQWVPSSELATSNEEVLRTEILDDYYTTAKQRKEIMYVV